MSESAGWLPIAVILYTQYAVQVLLYGGLFCGPTRIQEAAEDAEAANEAQKSTHSLYF